jgi:hypothetical protein
MYAMGTTLGIIRQLQEIQEANATHNEGAEPERDEDSVQGEVQLPCCGERNNDGRRDNEERDIPPDGHLGVRLHQLAELVVVYLLASSDRLDGL